MRALWATLEAILAVRGGRFEAAGLEEGVWQGRGWAGDNGEGAVREGRGCAPNAQGRGAVRSNRG